MDPIIQNLFKLHVNKEEFVAKDTRTMPDEFQKIISRTYVGGIPADIADYAKSKGDIESTDRFLTVVKFDKFLIFDCLALSDVLAKY